MDDRILDCPYCNSPDSECDTLTENGKEYYVYCDCGARGPIAGYEQDAILLWNAAANALAQKDAEIVKQRAMMHSQDEALADAQDKRDRYYVYWQAELQRVEAGNKRQDELEAEIEKLTTSANAVIEQRDGLRNKVSVLNKNLIETTDRAMIAEVQRDELRAELAETKERLTNSEVHRDALFGGLRQTSECRIVESKYVAAMRADAKRLTQERDEALDYVTQADTELEKMREQLGEVQHAMYEARRVERRLYATNKELIDTFARQLYGERHFSALYWYRKWADATGHEMDQQGDPSKLETWQGGTPEEVRNMYQDQMNMYIDTMNEALFPKAPWTGGDTAYIGYYTPHGQPVKLPPHGTIGQSSVQGA